VEGKGYAVCEAFLKNLNAFPANELPMVCTPKAHPTHPEFSTPKWEEMDVQSNLKLIHAAESQLLRFTRAGAKPLSYEQWLPTFQERVKSGELKPRLSKMVLALNQLGQETLISYEPVIGECVIDEKSSEQGRYIFVLREHAEVPLLPISSMTPDHSEILLFKGKPYFFWANGDMEQVGDGTKRIWVPGLDRISGKLTHDERYLRDHICTYYADRPKKL
jgi:hypothetical protein